MENTQLGTDIRTYSNNESLVNERRQHIVACAINVLVVSRKVCKFKKGLTPPVLIQVTDNAIDNAIHAC